MGDEKNNLVFSQKVTFSNMPETEVAEIASQKMLYSGPVIMLNKWYAVFMT